MVAKKRIERGYDHFANRRSQRPKPLKGFTTAQLLYTDEKPQKVVEEPVKTEESKLPVFEAFDKYPEGSQLKGW